MDKAQEMLEEIRASRLDQLDKFILDLDQIVAKVCESPIEQQLLLALASHFGRNCYKRDGIMRINGHISSIPGLERLYLEIVPQCPVTVKTFAMEDREFRIDILVELGVLPAPDRGWEVVRRYAIEADGHDFHEKTKEQARRDKERDRLLTASGLTVIRFAGSEIYKDPFDAANYLDELFMEHGFEYMQRKRSGDE